VAHGSFSTDRPDLYGRTDPRELVDILGVSVAGGGTVPSAAVIENTPNPFNTATEISFNLPEEQEVTLAIFDPAGRKICEVYSGKADRGRNTVTWNGTDASGRLLPSGVYFCKLELGSMIMTRKILRVR
jgi:flagellar hook assembly protein FlgD